METLHAHQVLNILKEHDKDITVMDLQKLITEKHGADVLFGSCSTSGMSLDDLITFFVERGKITFDGTNVSMVAGCGCGH